MVNALAGNAEFQTVYSGGATAQEFEEVLTRVLHEIHLVQE